MARFERATGRYVFLEVEGVEYRVYFEEAGEGIPLLLQHTAGSDGRQWRHLLADEELARNYRMIAYDLPYHGKSVPPTSLAWWQQEYRLTKRFLLAFVTGFARELGLDRPVYMGSSIGGHLATDLALHHPEQFRAIIGLEAAIATPGGYQDIWNHPAISNEFKASVMYGLMSPSSPEAFRHETAWCYSQGGPPTFKGDLYYYSVDHDLSDSAEKIDATRTPLHLLTGEYDWASPPAMTQILAERVTGARFTKMERLGHFPMSEDPIRFREYIAPVLEEIRARQR